MRRHILGKDESLSNVSLENALRATLVLIDRQINVVNEEAHERSVPPEYLKHADGHYVLAPFLLAKAQILSGLAQLRAL